MNSQKNKSALLYCTAAYPYGLGEQFIQNEIDGLCTKFDKVYLIPFDTSEKLHKTIPENCEIIDLNKDTTQSDKREMYFFFCTILLKEIIFSKKGRFILKNFKFLFGDLRTSYAWSKKMEKLINSVTEEGYQISFYSSWKDQNALSLAILKKLKKIEGFSFKMRGYDLFDERRPGGYMPFRRFIFNQADCILTMSKQGADYLKKKNICVDKIAHNYPGIGSDGLNKLKEGVFTLVSCSGLIPLKRVVVIAQALKYIEFEIKWVHFGDGPEMEKIKEIVDSLGVNVHVELKGNVENDSIRDYYINEKVDGLIHVSETEGFGYAIIEAYCTAIPTILYPAGGVTELIHSDFSKKINSPLNPESLANEISIYRENFEGKSKPKEDAYAFFLKNFQIDPNVAELYEYIKN